MRTKQLFLLLMALLPLPLLAQGTHDPTVVRLVNCGKMHVASSTTHASLFVPDAVVVRDSSSIVQNGVTAIGGNFYQAARSKVFALDADSNFTRSTGTVRFVTNSLFGKQRAITVWDNADAPYQLGSFDRSRYYIAFPNIEINTGDVIHIPAVLGMDSRNITRGTLGTAGVLYLESAPRDAYVHDASLRTIGSVVAGAVQIEKHVWHFRHDKDGNAYLLPFATPYTNQRAAYFAGNWLRAPRPDGNGHYGYPYGDKKATNGTHIDESQYVQNANEILSAGSPYLLRLQPQGYEYENGNDFQAFCLTGGSSHDLSVFVFDGAPYNLSQVAEQKFTGNLFDRTAPASKAQWLIGNSYTSAISVDSLREAIYASNISFSKYLYIYPHGGTAYKSYVLTDGSKIPDIPAMSVFMLIVNSTNKETAEHFVIRPSMQRHSGGVYQNGNGPALAAPRHDGTLTFHLTPEANPFIYDEAFISLWDNALESPDSRNISKPLNTSGQYFNIYIQSGDNKLQNNALPLSSTQISLCVTPPAHAMDCRLTVQGIESATTEALLLHDVKLNAWTDLRETGEYTFHSEPGDRPDRFVVYFQSPTGVDQIEKTQTVYGYYQDNAFYLNRLTKNDCESHIKLFNASGLLVKEAVIDAYPQYRISVPLPQGVYVAKIEGKNAVVIKFIKQ